MNKFEEKIGRVMAAVQLEDVDRVPFVSGGTAVNAAITGLPLSTYCTDMEANCTANIEGAKMLGDTVDGVQANIFLPDILPTAWLSEIKIPGRELSSNELWQIHEKELITQDDYDIILEGGFAPWYQQFMFEKLGNPMQYLGKFFEYMPTAYQRFAQAEIPVVNGANFYSPFEMFCGGRSLASFLMDDLFDIPEKLEKVFDMVQEFNMQNFEGQLRNPETRPMGAWVGGWRGTPSMLSPELFNKFSWKYMKEISDLLISYNVVPIFHLDSCWDNGIKNFLDIKKGKAIMALDGKTDIFKAKEIVGNHMCIMGDVPAEMLAFGTVDQVESYCKRLIKEIGPKGFILSSGCDIPFNAKLENLQAMAKSVK